MSKKDEKAAEIFEGWAKEAGMKVTRIPRDGSVSAERSMTLTGPTAAQVIDAIEALVCTHQRRQHTGLRIMPEGYAEFLDQNRCLDCGVHFFDKRAAPPRPPEPPLPPQNQEKLGRPLVCGCNYSLGVNPNCANCQDFNAKQRPPKK